MRRPLFVVFEGLDGAGKSTACEALAAEAGRRGLRSRVVKTPGSLTSPLAFSLRDPSSPASLLAFAIGNLEAVSEPTETDVIFVDRYMLSTLVHHATLFDASPDTYLGALRALGSPTPLLTVFLDVPTSLAQKRLSERSSDRALLVPLEFQRSRFRSLLADPRLNFLVGIGVVRNTAQPEDLVATVDEVLKRLSCP